MNRSDSDKEKTFPEFRYDKDYCFNPYDVNELSKSLIPTMSSLYFWYFDWYSNR